MATPRKGAEPPLSPEQTSRAGNGVEIHTLAEAMGEDRPQAEIPGDGEPNAGGQPDFTGLDYDHPNVKKYTHGGSAPAYLQPPASKHPAAGQGAIATDDTLRQEKENDDDEA